MNVFLDLDGTLTDPQLGTMRSVAYALKTLGLPVQPPEDMTWIIGPSLLESFGKMGVADPARALELYRERYATKGLHENELYPGIKDALADLTDSGFKLYLMTAKSRVYAVQITSNFGLTKYFTEEFGPELDGTRSDKAVLLDYALTKTGADPNKSVMVGDRIHDYRAAKAVGMKSIAVTWGFGCQAEWSEATQHIASPNDLRSTVQQMLCGE